jgi:FtsH-binding integral membrane protein
MRRVARWLGIGLLSLGAAAAVAEVFTLVASGRAGRVSLGTVWYGLSPNSLVGFQAAVERGLGELAVSALVAFLALPAWLVLGFSGFALWLVGRGERRGLG